MKLNLQKWVTYQKERFPLVKYSLLVSAFAASGLCLSFLLTGRQHELKPEMFGVAFLVTILLFFQLRVADEHKDFDFDAEHHPERPVPRGLVKLHELKLLAIIAGVIQLSAVFALNETLLIPLAAAWCYMWLMTREFFVGDWLRQHQIVYMLTHMCILFFTDLFITSCHFMVSNIDPPITLLYFLGTSFFLGTVIELGRKIKSPQDETTGLDTYTRLWGRETAVKAWLLAIGLSASFAIATAAQIQSGMLAFIVLSVMIVTCYIGGQKFLARSTTKAASRIDALSGLWTLTTYLMIGVVPFAVYLLGGAVPDLVSSLGLLGSMG